MGSLPKSKKSILVCCDFDGTITMQDAGVLLIDKCMGKETRVALDEKAMSGELTLRMWDSVDLSWKEAEQILENVQLDPKFKDFSEYCFANGIPIIIVSGGLKFYIEHLLKKFYPNNYKKFEIISNHGEIVAGNKWEVSFRDESKYGHDKGATLKEFQTKIASESGAVPYTVFCGDGVSDLSAAGNADLLFAKKGLGLARHCQSLNLHFEPFDDFQPILEKVAEEFSKIQ